MTARFRFWVAEKSRVGADVITPNSPACITVRCTVAVSRSSLAGMHPRCKHVPPKRSRSTRPTLRLEDDAANAAAYPAGPPPTTTRSKWFELILRPIVSAGGGEFVSVCQLTPTTTYAAMRTCAANARRIIRPAARAAMIKARVLTSAESSVLAASGT